MSSIESGYQGNAFYVGADRNTGTGTLSGSGQIVSNLSNEFAVRVKQGQRLNYYSTVTGSGSITFDSVLSSGDLLGELTLGFGRGPTESQTALALNDFTGGVTVLKAKLNLAEDSTFNGSGTMTSSAAGLGSILFTTGGASIGVASQLTGFDDRITSGAGSITTAGTRIVGNAVTFNTDVDITGDWRMEFRGSVTRDFENGRIQG